MKYMLLMYADESFVPNTPEEQETVALPVWNALMKEMKAEGRAAMEQRAFPCCQCDNRARSRGQNVDYRWSFC